jgi:hypothetical protein
MLLCIFSGLRLATRLLCRIQVSTAVFVYHLIKRTHVKHEHIQIFFQMVPFQVIQIDEAASREGLPLRKLEHAFYLDRTVHSFRITNCGVQDTTQVNLLDLYIEPCKNLPVHCIIPLPLTTFPLTDPHPHVLLELQRHHPIHH